MTIWRLKYSVQIPGAGVAHRDSCVCAPDPLQALMIDLIAGGDEPDAIRELSIKWVVPPDCIVGINDQSLEIDSQINDGDIEWLRRLVAKDQPRDTEGETNG